MSTEILISSDPWENRVAILEDGKLSEIYVEREERVIGSIYKGKVQNVLPGMGASFVDIGLGRNAFLYVDDINKTPLNIGDVEITQGRSGFTISEKVNRGDDVLVQIVKEPRGLKGARVSTNISLPGRYLILMPTGKYSGVSRKIESAEERNRLKAIMKRIRPEGMATVVRTAAAGASEAELIADLGVMIRMWHGILESYKRAPSPSLLHKDMNLVFKAARDFITADVDRVLIDDDEEYRKVREFLQLLGPQYLDRVEHYNSGRSLFKDYKVDEELHKLMRPKINLPSGASIVIESTEALTVIDVNSGKFTGGKNLEDTIVKTNVEAAAEIARQVRLRDIGGIIVCDFIDMNSESSRNKVIATLEEGLRKDRTRATIQSFSNLGLLEFTRKRIGRDLGSQLRGSCPTCAGLGSVLSSQSVAIDTFRQIREQYGGKANGDGSTSKVSHPIVVDAFPTVAAQLEYWYGEECKQLTEEIQTSIHPRVDALLHPERTKIHALPNAAALPAGKLRVGDEHEVDVLNMRLPNATSAVTVIDGRLVEVENGASYAGQTIRARIIDVADDSALAEPLGVPAAASKRKRRTKRAAAPTKVEEARQLRELAEEAAKGASSRAAIGISTAAEAEVEEAEVKEKTAATVEGETIVVSPGSPGRRKRRRRRRGRGADTAQVGIPVESAAAQVAATQPETPSREQSEGPRRRRRRRRGRGGERRIEQPDLGAAMPDRHIFRVGTHGDAEATGRTAPREPIRSLAPWNRRPTPPAVEPPPPSLSVPAEPAKVTKPARRRRAASAPVTVGGELEASTIAALTSADQSAKLNRGRKKSSATASRKKSSTPRASRRKKNDASSTTPQ
ncbi:MAG: Rne/Rng family ribonuclease [Candidatus Eremiobacteraeota bacterium]|nr:Rne/Rng family ribonuclease [Candidatus Eremiobacteraeota bacterium]